MPESRTGFRNGERGTTRSGLCRQRHHHHQRATPSAACIRRRYTREGCLGEDDIRVRFMSGPNIYVPNAFTPNGDGVNDVFRPLPVGITKLELFRVFNRWGEEVFRTNEYMKGWDGKTRGRVADAGTYVWIVQGTNTAGEQMEKRGTVTLIR